eukprot:scaffold1904_cov280-Chaetoceros_neogracile.AAC.46
MEIQSAENGEATLFFSRMYGFHESRKRPFVYIVLPLGYISTEKSGRRGKEGGGRDLPPACHLLAGFGEGAPFSFSK